MTTHYVGRRGRCAVCHHRVSIRSDGMLRLHGAHGEPWCPGSAQPPEAQHKDSADVTVVMVFDDPMFKCGCGELADFYLRPADTELGITRDFGGARYAACRQHLAIGIEYMIRSLRGGMVKS